MTDREAIDMLRYYSEHGLGEISTYEAGEIADILEEMLKLEREKNDPLTIEELREMDGKPVWIERNSPDDREWASVFCREKFCRTSRGNIALFGLYDIGWLAYRHKPEEEQHG